MQSGRRYLYSVIVQKGDNGSDAVIVRPNIDRKHDIKRGFFYTFTILVVDLKTFSIWLKQDDEALFLHYV